MSNIINSHWTKGGTGVTNFGVEERPLYEAAIKEYGKPYLVIHDEPMEGPALPDSLSLHNVRGKRGDLSDFWEIFWRLRAEMSQPAGA
jgi:hypothetical protein